MMETKTAPEKSSAVVQMYREADLNCRPSGYESDALTS